MLRATSPRPDSGREEVGVPPEMVALVVFVCVPPLVADVVTAETPSRVDRAFDPTLGKALVNVLLIGSVAVKLGVIAVGGGSGVESVVAESKLSSSVVLAAAAVAIESISCDDSEDGSR